MENLTQYGIAGVMTLVFLYKLKMDDEKDKRDNDRRIQEDARQADAFKTIKRSIDAASRSSEKFVAHSEKFMEHLKDMGSRLGRIETDIKDCKESLKKGPGTGT